MAGMDWLHNDAFGLQQMTERINKAVLRPTMLSPYFREVPVSTTVVTIEEQSERATLLRVKARGAPPDRHIVDPRKLYAFVIPQLSKEDRIMADEVQNVRAFGTESELQTIQGVVDGRAATMRADVETTWEYHRLGAVQGKILDSDGTTVVLDINATFGITQTAHNFVFSAAGTDIRDVVVEGSRLVEDELQGVPFSGMVAIVGRNFFDALIAHANVQASFVAQGDGSQQRNDLRRTGFVYGGWTFYEYPGGLLIRNPDDPDGAKIPFMNADIGYAFPNSDIFAMYFAPADFMETVNTLGRPMYSKTAPDAKYNRWADVYVQSNPLALCTRPKSVLKLTKS